MDTTSRSPTLEDILEHLRLSAPVPPLEPFAAWNDAGTGAVMFPDFPEFEQYPWETMEGFENDAEEGAEMTTGFGQVSVQYD